MRSNLISRIKSLLFATLEITINSVISSEKHLKFIFSWINQGWLGSLTEFAPKRRNSTKLGDEIIIHSHPVSLIHVLMTISSYVQCCKTKFYLVSIRRLQSPITRTDRGVLERVVRRRQSTSWIVGQIKLNDLVSRSANI